MFQDSDQIVNTFFTQADEFVEKLRAKELDEEIEAFPTTLSDAFRGLVK